MSGRTRQAPASEQRLRALPAVDRLADQLIRSSQPGEPPPTRNEAILAARAVIAERRAALVANANGASPVANANGASPHSEADLLERARRHLRPSLRRVLNATGVVIHTNLGRAPLPDAAVAAVHEAAHGYANLELDLDTGRRGSRESHVRDLLLELTGAQDALVVNNGAGAALLAIAAIAGGAAGVAVSRAQLVEIGGGFRIPDVLAQAGAAMIEVGTTNRTRFADYRQAIVELGATAILRVHQSNFRIVGFVEEVPIEELCGLGVPVIDDLGSGVLAGGLSALADEPPVSRSLAAGATLVCFSGDKLLGGPQAGVLLGAADAIGACRRHPLARALRIGRLPLAGLEATLALYRDPQRALREVPVLAMLSLDDEALSARAERLLAACGEVDAEIVDAVARVGGGALPLLELRGPAIAIGARGGDPEALAASLRDGDPPLVPRISRGRVLVDPRTLADEEIDDAGAAIGAALRRGRPISGPRVDS